MKALESSNEKTLNVTAVNSERRSYKHDCGLEVYGELRLYL